MSERLVSSWSEDSVKWFPYSKNEYSTDEQGNNYSTVYFYWISESGDYYPVQRDDKKYEGGKLTDLSIYFWDSDSASFILTERELLIYDEAGNFIFYSFYQWTDSLGDYKFMENSRAEYTYNNDYTLEDLVIPSDEDIAGYFAHMLTSISEYGLNDSAQTIPVSRTSLYFNTLTVNPVQEVTLSDIRPYPNPARETITILSGISPEYRTIELVDMQGRTVLKKSLAEGNVISVKDVPEGIYFYRISGNNGITSGKLLIKK
jgi:hypothetical protein